MDPPPPPMDPPPPPPPMDPPPPPPVDLLSSLAEDLQNDILKRLDLRDAVRASALSHAWRRRWETVPGLALSFPDGTPASAIDRVLLCYAGPCVSRFAIHYVYGGQGDVDRWLIALSRRTVESISIFNNPGRTLTVHPSIFSCNRLVSLSLEHCYLPQLPQPGGGLAGFPVLKELYLSYVVYFAEGEGESQFQAMIRASPMLRVLFLEDVYLSTDTDYVIEAPNLHTLGLISDYDWRFGDLPCLQYASIIAYPQGGSAGFTEFVNGVSQVQELIFYIELACDFKMDATPFTFSNLKSMELSAEFDDIHNILLVFFLLRSSPNIERLKIELRCPQIVGTRKFLNSQWTDGMCAKLQVVEIASAEGSLPLSFMKLILSKASRLRTLSMDKCPVSHNDQLNKLLNCRRASPQAQIQFKDQIEKINFDRMKFVEKRQN